MPRLKIEGGSVLKGEVSVDGAKNAVLPILAASLMLDGKTVLKNVPHLLDVTIMLRMLNGLGVTAEFYNHSLRVSEEHKENEVVISNTKKIRHIAPYDLVTSMRASFFVLGPILAKTGFAKVPLPGGCSIGTRPVDLHIHGLEALGADISIQHGFVSCHAKKLKGAPVHLSFPSVGATENIVMAACLADGETVIENAAQEPEVEDLARFLVQAGAKIEGAGTGTIHVQGVQSLQGVSPYSIIPDRVEAGTLLIAGAITKGHVTVNKVVPKDLRSLLDVLYASGLKIDEFETSITVDGDCELLPVDIQTAPFPGFPTDMQAQMMALLATIKGKSVVKESIFENRFMHARELMRMGAKIQIEEHIAVVTGTQLSGAEVRITDLRAGAALILAGLVADGYTNVYGLRHLNRGYCDLPGKLKQLGATVSS